MALVIYPAPLADSFITVADATIVIDKYTVNGAEWAILSVNEQEIYLRIAYRRILDGIDLTVDPLPTVIPTCVGDSQALIAIHDIVNNISATAGAGVTGEIKKQKVASLEVEYFQSDSGFVATEINPIPDMARDCLSDLGYVFASTSNKFKQQRLGRM